MHNYDKEADLVSIIIPFYNTERYIGKCLKSVAEQTYKNIEVIVVDDGSTDDSASIVQHFCENDKRFNLIKQKNGGASSARNTGLREIKGKYITFLDSDDTFHCEAIERLYREITDSGVDIVVPCLFKEVYEGNRIIKMQMFFPDEKENLTPINFVINKMIYCSVAWRCSSVLYKSDIIKNHNLRFDVGYTAEDFLFNLKYFCRVKSMDILSFPTLNVTKRIDSITASYNPKLMDLFLFIDFRVVQFLKNSGFNEENAREIADSLLCRNVIVFMTSEMRAASMKSFKAHKNNVKNALNDVVVRNALNRKNVRPPYFINKKKMLVAKILFVLLRSSLFGVAITTTWFFGKMGKSYKQKTYITVDDE